METLFRKTDSTLCAGTVDFCASIYEESLHRVQVCFGASGVATQSRFIFYVEKPEELEVMAEILSRAAEALKYAKKYEKKEGVEA